MHRKRMGICVCCIFQPAFGCCALQNLFKICFFNICVKKLKKEILASKPTVAQNTARLVCYHLNFKFLIKFYARPLGLTFPCQFINLKYIYLYYERNIRSIIIQSSVFGDFLASGHIFWSFGFYPPASEASRGV